MPKRFTQYRVTQIEEFANLKATLAKSLGRSLQLFSKMLGNQTSSSINSGMRGFPIASQQKRGSISLRGSIQHGVEIENKEDTRFKIRTRLVPQVAQTREWGALSHSFNHDKGLTRGQFNVLNRRSTVAVAEKTRRSSLPSRRSPTPVGATKHTRRLSGTSIDGTSPSVVSRRRLHNTAMHNLKPVDARERVLSRHTSALGSEVSTRAAEQIFQRKLTNENCNTGRKTVDEDANHERVLSAYNAIGVVNGASIGEAAGGILT